MSEDGVRRLSFEAPRRPLKMHQPQTSMPPTNQKVNAPEWRTTAVVLPIAAVCWLVLSFIDHKYTPRPPPDSPHYFETTPVIQATYQWCMVAYFCNLLFTIPKIFFETNSNKLMLHLLIAYISFMAATSYLMVWTGFSPILVDIKSCLYIPQRWMLYCFTAPAIITILAKISNYTFWQRVWVVWIFEIMLITGAFGTIPWITWNEKVFWYIVTNLPFPEILLHMWRMVISATNEAEPSSKNFLTFIAVFTEATWIIFPIVYYAAIVGLPLYISEPLWSLTDWLTKFVFASSLMETNFFTLEQRRAETMRKIEEGHRSATIVQLTKAIERKDDFLSTMSHELRTPLNGIIGLSESLLEGSVGTMSEKAHQTIKVVVLSAKRLLQLINDVLDAAKLKQGTMVIKHETVNIRAITNDVLDLCSPLIKKGVRLINMVGNIPTIIGDNGRIAQILYNLVGNAAKFTDHGTISVTAGVAEDGSKVYISVTDTGEGIPEEKLENIFVAFEQVDMSTTRRHGGTGLGLHLVKELVKSHNGEIAVSSTVGKGSTFTVWLPVTQADDSHVDQELRGQSPYDDEEEEEDIYTLTTGTGAAVAQGVSLAKAVMGRSSEDSEPDKARPTVTVNKPAGRKSAEREKERERGGRADRDGRGGERENGGRGSGKYRGSTDEKKNQSSSASKDDMLLSSTKSGFFAVKPFYREVNHGGCMVLSVDDDPINQMVVDNLLAPEGFTIEQAMNGMAALNFLEECNALPDVILLDVMMPDISGYEVCAEIRRRYSSVYIPIIMVSAKGNPEHVMKGLESGSVDYVKKPFHRKELLSRIRAQIRNREVFEAEMASRKVNDTLKRLMPMSVIQRLQQGSSMIADSHEEVSVLFADMHGLSSHGQQQSTDSTAEIITIMNQMYTAFERLLNKHKVFRVEHTGDSYMAVSGHDGATDHAQRMIELARDIINLTQNMKFPNGDRVCIRVGIHSGPAYAGVVGLENPRYCVFGDTVNIASRLESTTYPQTVQVSEAFAAKDNSLFVPYRKVLDAGAHTLSTFLLKAGDYEAAQKHKPAEGEGKVPGAVMLSSLFSSSDAEALQAKAASAAKQAEELKAKLAVASQEAQEYNGRVAAAHQEIKGLQAHIRFNEQEQTRLQDMVQQYEAELAQMRKQVSASGGNSPSPLGKAEGLTPEPSTGSVAGGSARPHVHRRASIGAPGTGFMLRDLGGASMSRSYASSVAGSEAISVINRSETAARMLDDFFQTTYPIDKFLKDLGLEEYTAKLRAQKVTPIVLASMTLAELSELGIDAVGARRRIMEAAKQYQSRLEAATRMMLIYKDGEDGESTAESSLAHQAH